MTLAPEQFLDEKASMACIHCGLCLGSCPTYLETGNENDSPRGRIYLMRAVQDGRLPLSHTAVHHIDTCLGCRACEAACPSGVQYGSLLETTRDHIERHHTRPPLQQFLRRILIERVLPHPLRTQLALLPARLIKRAQAEHLFPQFIRDTLALLPDTISAGQLPEISPAERAGDFQPPSLVGRVCPSAPSGRSADPTARWGQTRPTQVPPTRGRVGLIRGCVMNVMFGRTNENTIRLLNHAGYDVITPRDQGCCGALHAHGGNLAAARDAARANLDAFSKEPLDAIIINAAGCGSTLKEYAHLLPGNPQAAAFSAKVKDLSEFLVAAGFTERLSSKQTHPSPASPHSPFPIPHSLVSFHDACHLAHAQRITHAPRVLVKAVAGSNYIEMPESDICCGSAGSYNLTEPAMAERLQSRKVDNILRTGATCIVTTNPGCLLQMRAGLDKAGATHIETLHIADYLARSLAQPPQS